MIFIFGFRSRGAVLATVTLACRNGHVAAHRIIRLTRWFTLFFVPVIPFSRKYRSICIQNAPLESAEARVEGRTRRCLHLDPPPAEVPGPSPGSG